MQASWWYGDAFPSVPGGNHSVHDSAESQSEKLLWGGKWWANITLWCGLGPGQCCVAPALRLTIYNLTWWCKCRIFSSSTTLELTPKSLWRYYLTWMYFSHRSHEDDIHWDVLTPRRVWLLSDRSGLGHNLLSEGVEGIKFIFGCSFYPLTWEYYVCVCREGMFVTGSGAFHSRMLKASVFFMWTFSSTLWSIFIKKIPWPKWHVKLLRRESNRSYEFQKLYVTHYLVHEEMCNFQAK